jgi:hypothetical protein
MADETKVYTMPEFAQIMRISLATAYKYAREKLIPVVAFGDRYLISGKTINAIISGEIKTNRKEKKEVNNNV